VLGDILSVPVAVVVTAANTALAGGGGVDGAVHRAAGPQLFEALRPLAPCPPGSAVVTPAFDLPAPRRWVVHAVGPRFGVDEPAAELLSRAYQAALAQCDEVGARSVVFPALSAGAFGYPKDEACRISIDAIRSAETRVERCVLVTVEPRIERFWLRYLGAPSDQ
jgi:O-acetyl-ADP-ribose deacetylase (regulator of RNase III)